MYGRFDEDGNLQMGGDEPPYGLYKDGRTVSGPLVDWTPDELLEVGWLPIIDESPAFDDATQILVGPDYQSSGDRIVAHYEVQEIVQEEMYVDPVAQKATDRLGELRAKVALGKQLSAAELQEATQAFLLSSIPA